LKWIKLIETQNTCLYLLFKTFIEDNRDYKEINVDFIDSVIKRTDTWIEYNWKYFYLFRIFPKKTGACVFWAPYFFLSILAENNIV